MNEGNSKHVDDTKSTIADFKTTIAALAGKAESALGRRTARVLGLLVLVFALSVLLRWYVAPTRPEQRIDLVLALAQIVAGVGLFGGLYFTWRGQQQTQENLDKTLRENWKQETYKWQSDALQKYFEHMEDLLAKKDLRHLEKNAPERIAAASATWALLQMLDTHRKYFQLQFLYHLGLVVGDDPVISLRAVHLWAIKLSGDDLSRINLSGADLSPWIERGTPAIPSYLRRTTLDHAILRDANFREAELMGASLRCADLTGANLTKANLSPWWQTTPRLSSRGTTLSEADVSFGPPTDAGWYPLRTSLHHAVLRDTDLQESNLRYADLTHADLTHADLTHADLRATNLYMAQVTKTQLESCESLEGATMPDGSKHP